jgi:hypothetical protein
VKISEERTEVDLKQEFVGAVSDHFRQITPLLDSELAAMTRKTYPGSVRFFLFEYDSPHFSEDFPVSMWPMGTDGNPVEDGLWFLKGKAVAAPTEIYEAEKYEVIEPWDTASELLECWLVERWSKIAEQRRAYRAFIGHRDSYFKKNLLTGQQTNWDEILEAING